MNNYERHFGSIAEAADFIQRHTTCMVCPAGECRAFEGFEECEGYITQWLLEEDEDDG